MAVSTLFDISDQYRNLSISDDNFGKCFQCFERVENTQFLPCNHSICYSCMASRVATSNFSCVMCMDEATLNEAISTRHQTQLYELFSTQQRNMASLDRSRTSSYEDSIVSLSPTRISPPLSSSVGIMSSQTLEPITSRYSPGSFNLIMESLTMPEQNVSSRCARCFIEEQFPFRCENCSDVLCTLCATNHASSVATRDHIVRRLSNTQLNSFSSAVGSELRSPVRQNRDERIPSPLSTVLSRDTLKIVTICGHDFSGTVYYCANCINILCFDCVVRHENHKAFPLQGSQDIFKEIFKEIMSEVENWVTEVNVGYRKSKEILDKLSMRAVNVAAELQENFKKIMDTLHMREKILKDKLVMVEHLKKQTLYEQITYLNESKEQLLSIQNSIQSCINSQNVSELLGLHCKVKGDLKNFDVLGTYLKPHEEDVLSFQAPIANVCNGLNNLGTFVSLGYAKNTYAFGVNMNSVIIGTSSSVTVQSVDHSGEKRVVGGDEIKATVRYQNNKKQLEVQDHGTGLYTVYFSIFEYVPHTIYITMRQQRISNSPFTPSIKGIRQYQSLKYPIATYGTEIVNEVSVKRPWGIHCDRDGFLYVSDRSNNCIHVLNPDGSLHHRFGSRGSTPGKLNRPAGIAVDVNRRIIVADKDNHRIQLFTFDGNFLFTFGNRGNNPGEFFYPWGIDTDYKGQIVVTDTRNHRIQLFDSNGTFLSSLGSSSVVLWREMDNPRGVCFGPDGQIFVTDFNNHQVAVIDKDLNKSTIKNFGKFGDGEGEFNRPQGIMVDPFGNLLVVDTRNHRVNVFTLTGIYVCCFGLGDGKKQIMDRPVDIALSPDGSVFLVDFGNDCVRRF